MTKFNPANKETLTFGETLEPAMEIQDEADAKQYMKDYITFIQKELDKKPREDNKTAEQIVKINLGYFAGYYDNKTRERVERLFCCSHPIFGSIKNNGIPTSKEAFNSGRKL
jgi:hypothetical protein